MSRIDVFDIMFDSLIHGPNKESEEVKSIDYEEQSGPLLVTMKAFEGTKTKEADGEASAGGLLVAVATRNKVHSILLNYN